MEIKTEVPEGTKFEARGFAPAAETDPAAELTPEQADQQVNAMMGTGMEVPADPNESEPEIAPTVPPAAKVKIGTREFATADEAWTYAQELEQEKIASDAFRQGVEVASAAHQGNPAPQTQEPEQIDPLYYTDPAAYFRRREAEIAAQVTAQVNQGLSLKERNQQTWGKFYTDYPDLGKAQPLVNLVLNQEWEQLKHVETGKALKIIAEKARQMKRDMLADELPGTALPQVRQGASAGKGTGVTPAAPQEQASTLIEQMRKLKVQRSARR